MTGLIDVIERANALVVAFYRREGRWPNPGEHVECELPTDQYNSMLFDVLCNVVGGPIIRHEGIEHYFVFGGVRWKTLVGVFDDHVHCLLAAGMLRSPARCHS